MLGEAQPDAAGGAGAPDRSAPRAPPEPGLTPARRRREAAKPRLDVVDPNARITTGPGVPTWSWRHVELEWSGPVARGETLRLWLIPPWGNALAALLRAVLLGLLAAVALGLRRPALAIALGGPAASRAGLAAILLALAVLTAPAPARAAEFPSDEMLQDLRERLTEPAPCIPRCVEITVLRLDASAARAEARARRLGRGADRARAAGQRRRRGFRRASAWTAPRRPR